MVRISVAENPQHILRKYAEDDLDLRGGYLA
jgi:hypothetical protein